MSPSTRRFAVATMVTAALALNLAGPVNADPPQPVGPIDPPISIPAADSCVDFGLLIGSTEGRVRSVEFDGGARLIQIVTGISYTFTNDTSGTSITTGARGGTTSTVDHADGSKTVTATGTNILILFSTDVNGPSATSYSGRIVYTIDQNGVFTLQSASGASLNICAALT